LEPDAMSIDKDDGDCHVWSTCGSNLHL